MTRTRGGRLHLARISSLAADGMPRRVDRFIGHSAPVASRPDNEGFWDSKGAGRTSIHQVICEFSCRRPRRCTGQNFARR